MASKKHGGNEKWLVVYHKTSGRKKIINHKRIIEKQLKKAGADYKMIEVAYTDAQPMPNLKDVYEQEEFGRIIVAGGDGGLRRVIEQLWQHKLLHVEVAFYPIGTASLMARALRQPAKELYLEKVLINPERVEWGLNLLNGEHVFLIAACFGRVAAFTTRTTTRLKRRFGFGAYVLVGARLAYKFPKVAATLITGKKKQHIEDAHSLLFFSFRAAKGLLPFKVETRDPLQLITATHPHVFAWAKSAIELISSPKRPSHVDLIGLKKTTMQAEFGSKVHIDGDQLMLNTTTHTIEALKEKITLLV